MKTKILKKFVTNSIATAALVSAVSVNAAQTGAVVSINAYWTPNVGQRSLVDLVLSDQPGNVLTIDDQLLNPALALYQAAGSEVYVNLGYSASVNKGSVPANMVRTTLYNFGQGLAYVQMGDWSGYFITSPPQATAAALSFTNNKPVSVWKMAAPVWDQNGVYMGMLNDVAITLKVSN